MKDIIKSHCNSCKHDTNHTILFKKGVSNEENGYHEEYHIIECLGCELISFAISESFSGDPEDTYWRNFPDPLFWDVYDFLKDDAFDSLPTMISDLYEEVINAFKTDSSVLAGIGLRTLIEAVCLQQKIEGKNLQEKIENLHKQGLVSKAD